MWIRWIQIRNTGKIDMRNLKTVLKSSYLINLAMLSTPPPTCEFFAFFMGTTVGQNISAKNRYLQSYTWPQTRLLHSILFFTY
jgi:hypothetical protein